MEYNQQSGDVPEMDSQDLLDHSCRPEDLVASSSWSPQKEREKYKVSVLICSLMVELRDSRHCFLVKECLLANMFFCFFTKHTNY